MRTDRAVQCRSPGDVPLRVGPATVAATGLRCAECGEPATEQTVRTWKPGRGWIRRRCLQCESPRKIEPGVFACRKLQVIEETPEEGAPPTLPESPAQWAVRAEEASNAIEEEQTMEVQRKCKECGAEDPGAKGYCSHCWSAKMRAAAATRKAGGTARVKTVSVAPSRNGDSLVLRLLASSDFLAFARLMQEDREHLVGVARMVEVE